jgi:(p)ppGpp synthase/HD superfamily hydrolase
LSQILEAARYAERMHRGVIRKYTGEPYIMHPARVAGIISFHPLSNEVMVQAAWLHDVVEDCGVEPSAIDYEFGLKVGLLVRELTNPSKRYAHLSRHQRKKIDLDHISQVSPEAKRIKIVDRIDNLYDYPSYDSKAVDFVRSTYYNESLAIYKALIGCDEQLVTDFKLCLDNIRIKFEIGD